MTEKLPRSPIFGTYGLTVTFQTCLTPSPSSVPSAPPSSTPSSTPSDEPLLHPSNAPSSEPSCAPSDEPSSIPSVSPTSTCPISEFTGRSFLLPLLDACFKMGIFDGDSIYVDESDGDCLNPKFDKSNPVSYYGGTKDGNKATFNTGGNQVNGQVNCLLYKETLIVSKYLTWIFFRNGSKSCKQWRTVRLHHQ
jgi:hypothetical protein